MKRIVTLAGSNSRQSINKHLINYTIKMLDEVEIIQLDLNDFELPMFGVDHESDHGIPTLVKELSKIFALADGFVISLAEYNGSYSSVFKNTIDWLSRISTEIWNLKPMLLMATSPGGRGGASVLQSALISFPYLGAEIIESFSLPSFYENFSDGNIIDPSFKSEHQAKVAHFVQAIS